MPAAKNQDFDDLLNYLRDTRGFDLRAYKRTTLMRRIEKRLQAVNVESYAEYLDYIQVHPEEFGQLFNTILINVTAFFRDAESWQYIRDSVVPCILESKASGDEVRIWCAGCASGEETYSIATLFAEAMGHNQFKSRVKLYATDLDGEALQQARQASYSASDLKSVDQLLIDRYFEQIDSGEWYVFDRELRRSIIFGKHDLISDAPISRIDFLVCRNTLMYFNAEVQARILDRFHFAIRDGGFLFLGKAEAMMTHGSNFVPSDMKHRVFTKSEGKSKRDRLTFLTKADRDANERFLPPSEVRLRDMLLDASPVAQMVIGSNGALSLANVSARTRFGLNQADIGRPFQDLEISYKPVEIRSLLEQARAQKRTVVVKEIVWPLPNGELTYFDIEIVPVAESQESRSFCVTFTEVTEAKRLKEGLLRFNQELETAYEELQSTNEELQTTNEELQSTVEELETTNEELHSTNEELETVNGELQTKNAELGSSNAELRKLGEALDRSKAFGGAVLDSLSSAVIVVDREMKTLAWNDRAYDLWGLRAEEVKDKHLLNLDIGFPVEHLRQPIRKLLNAEESRVEFDIECINRRGKQISTRVVCGPLASPNDETMGVIVSIEEVGGANRA